MSTFPPPVNLSNLEVVQKCQQEFFTLFEAGKDDIDDGHIPLEVVFSINDIHVGYMTPGVCRKLHTEQLLDPSKWRYQACHPNVKNLNLSAIAPAPINDRGPVFRPVCLDLTPTTVEERSEVIRTLLSAARERRIFKSLDAWRDELYPIYGKAGELLCTMERAAASLFGINTYGVHMTVFVRGGPSGNAEDIRIWVPRRAVTKATYPGMLDNSVAGGIPVGEDPFESLVREAAEEASLPEDIVREAAVPCGTVSYHHIVREEPYCQDGHLYQPELQFVFDLEVDEEVVPKPNDGEVEWFKLMTIDEVKRALAQGKFKPNCGLVMLDFFIRHGIIDKWNEPDLDEIIFRIHMELPFPMKKRSYLLPWGKEAIGIRARQMPRVAPTDIVPTANDLAPSLQPASIL